MKGRVLVVNAGSSSVKLSVLDEDDGLVASESVPAPGGKVDQDALTDVVRRSQPISAVGHRIVHGGTEFVEPVLIDEKVVRKLEALGDLAPLHQPKSLVGLEAVSRLLPGVPAVACFDTAFHATIPPEAHTYALPPQWRRRWELRRYGFHGLSHAYASRRVAEMMAVPMVVAAAAAPAPSAGGTHLATATARPAGKAGPGASPGPLRVVTCHLGAGASLAAVRGGASVDTTMGFTPLEGLVMATRSGSVDPGLVLWLEEHVGMPPAELASTLEHRSGLFGLAGTPDMRQVLEAEAAGDQAAVLAMGVYLHRLRGAIASMAAAMDGFDAVCFTGGVGERSGPVRRRAAEGLGFLGVSLDLGKNEHAAPDCELSAQGARVRTFLVEAREDLEIVRGVRSVLGGTGG
jgi:acetate kinase